MKKLLTLAVLVATLGLTAAAESPIKLSLYDNIAWPKTNHANVVLGIVDANTPTVHGISWVIGSSRVDQMWGWSAAYIYARSNEMRGLQGAIYNVTHDGIGWAGGLVNVNKGTFTGLYTGLVTLGQDMTGVQFGFYNQAEKLTGLQLGLINNARRVECGLQIGLVNIIKENGWLPVMVIVNGRF